MAANGLTLDDLQIKISVDAKAAYDGIKKLTDNIKSLNTAGANTDGLQNLLTMLRNIGNEGERLSAVANRIREITAALNETNRQFGLALAMGDLAEQAAHAHDAIENVQDAADNAFEGTQVFSALDTVPRYISPLEKLGSAFRAIGSAARTAGAAIFNFAKRAAAAPFKGLNNALDRVRSRLSTLAASVKRIAFYRMIRSAIKGVTQALKEGVSMLIEWDRTYGNNTSYAARTADEIAAKWREVKKSLGAAAMPLIQIFQPALMSLMQTVINVANVINQVLRALQGFGTYIKATDKGFKSAVGSAKELKNILFGFDELNVLPSANGGGASANVGGIDFEEVDIDSKLKFNVDAVREKFKGFFGEIQTHLDTFKQSVSEGGLTFSNFAALVGGIAGTIGKYVGGVFKSLGETIKGFVDKFNLEGTAIGGILTNIGNFFVDFGELVEGIFNVDLPTIVGSLRNIVNDALGIVTGGLDIIGGIINSFLDWLEEKTGIDFAALKNGVSTLISVIKGIINFGLGGLLQTVVGWFGEILKFGGDTIVNILRMVNGLFKVLEGIFTLDFEKILLGMEEIGKGAANIVLGAIELIVNAILEPIRTVARAINNFKISIPDWIPLVGGKSWNPQVTVPGRVSFERFADGGFMPNTGSLFLAGEQGAELVTHAPGGTEVMNGNQVEQAMTNANVEVINAIYAMANMVVGAVNNKNFDIYMDTQKVGKSVTQYQLNYARAMGV